MVIKYYFFFDFKLSKTLTIISIIAIIPIIIGNFRSRESLVRGAEAIAVMFNKQ